MKKIFTIIALAVILQSCEKEEKRFENPKQLISVKEAKELNLRYINERSRLISESLKIEDANAIWYSIEELENYIYYAKTQGAKKGYKIDGIRFYLGVYSKDPRNAEKAGLTTIFLTPTGKKVNQKAAMLNFSTAVQEKYTDVTIVEPLNYGGMGNPPKIIYGQ
jgi:hypothetical protein